MNGGGACLGRFTCKAGRHGWRVMRDKRGAHLSIINNLKEENWRGNEASALCSLRGRRVMGRLAAEAVGRRRGASRAVGRLCLQQRLHRFKQLLCRGPAIRVVLQAAPHQALRGGGQQAG